LLLRRAGIVAAVDDTRGVIDVPVWTSGAPSVAQKAAESSTSEAQTGQVFTETSVRAKPGSGTILSMTSNPLPPLTFRSALPGDASVIVALVESAYRGDASRQGWTHEADLLDGQRTDLEEVSRLLARAHEDGRVLLATRGPDLIACCHVERRGDAGYFGMFSVEPKAQGGGIGRLVLTEAERIAREEWRCRAMTMTVIDVRTELIAWYERRGYVRTGEHQAFPYGDARFGLPKRNDLRFEVLKKPL
jgi:GNAT superfamily N-acetyltransferase